MFRWASFDEIYLNVDIIGLLLLKAAFEPQLANGGERVGMPGSVDFRFSPSLQMDVGEGKKLDRS